MINPDYDISVSVCNYIFNYLLYNIILPPKCLAFPHLGQSRWEDKITSTKIRGSSTPMKSPERVFVSGLIILISIINVCVTMVICYNLLYSKQSPYIILTLDQQDSSHQTSFSPMLRCVANDMNRWEIFPSLLIGTSIYIYVLLLATFWQHSVSWEKMHFTRFSRKYGFFFHSSPNPALAATRLWAGYGELVGENSHLSWKTM